MTRAWRLEDSSSRVYNRDGPGAAGNDTLIDLTIFLNSIWFHLPWHLTVISFNMQSQPLLRFRVICVSSKQRSLPSSHSQLVRHVYSRTSKRLSKISQFSTAAPSPRYYCIESFMTSQSCFSPMTSPSSSVFLHTQSSFWSIVLFTSICQTPGTSSKSTSTLFSNPPKSSLWRSAIIVKSTYHDHNPNPPHTLKIISKDTFFLHQDLLPRISVSMVSPHRIMRMESRFKNRSKPEYKNKRRYHYITHPAWRGERVVSYGSQLLEMPDELLLEITSYLDYHSLHRFRETCNKIYNFTFDRTLDATFFRSTLQLPRPMGNYDAGDVKLHPVFTELDLLKTSIDQCTMLNKHHAMPIKVMDSVCWMQMATNPPVNTIRFAIGNLPTQVIHNKHGIRVANLISRVCKLLGKDNRQGLKLSDIWFQHFDESQWGARRESDLRVARNIDMLGTNSFMEQFTPSHKTPKGALVLRAKCSW